MLIVTRKPGQTVNVDDNISVTVLDIAGDRVRLGINAPRDIRIKRSELTTLRSLTITQRIKVWLGLHQA